MRAMKAVTCLGLAAAAVLVARQGLQLALDDLSNADAPARPQVADARAAAPRPTLAPVMTPSPEPSDPLPEIQAEIAAFGSPDPEYGQPRPALGQPAVGMEASPPLAAPAPSPAVEQAGS